MSDDDNGDNVVNFPDKLRGQIKARNIKSMLTHVKLFINV